MRKLSKQKINNIRITIWVLIILGFGGYYLFNNISANTNSQQKEINALKKTVEDLKNTKPQIITQDKYISDTLSSDSIEKWKNLSVYIECTFNNTNLVSTGSGIIQNFGLSKETMTAKIVTNKHVVTDSQGYSANYCNFYMYGGHTYYEPYTDFELGSGDWAYIPIPSDTYSQSVTYKKTCKNSSASLGDKITIFGYPTDGSHSGVTVTSGIISGDEGNYYVTDAKIDHGNSGGIAVLNKDDCYLGIPTWAQSGSIESFGRILKSSFVFSD